MQLFEMTLFCSLSPISTGTAMWGRRNTNTKEKVKNLWKAKGDMYIG